MCYFLKKIYIFYFYFQFLFLFLSHQHLPKKILAADVCFKISERPPPISHEGVDVICVSRPYVQYSSSINNLQVCAGLHATV